MSSCCTGCGHELCVQCALYLCSTSNTPSEIMDPPGSIPCPLCRNGIVSFVKLPTTPVKGLKTNLALTLCNPCILNTRAIDIPIPSRIESRRNRAPSSELVCPLICSPFPSVVIPSCNFDAEPSSTESQAVAQPQQAPASHTTPNELEKMEEHKADSSCSGMFWGRRSCQREHQCNSEINA